MDKNAIKKYAVWARNELIARVTQKAQQYGITETDIIDANADSINGKLLTDTEKKQRQALIKKINDENFEQVMEEVAYTWFNRFTALRFMEVNNYLPSHTRVFTNEANEFKPQILTDAISLDLEGLDMDKVYELKDANKNEELYKYLLIVQCNALNSILPVMFQKLNDYTELLFPENLLREGSVVDRMVSDIDEQDWEEAVEIIGWLYQYYIAEPKDDLINAKKQYKLNDVPFVTQIFTSDWIVKYMVENSLGRMWAETGADISSLNWDYFLRSEEANNTHAPINPESIRLVDPCMGSGHILVYAFDVLMQIYQQYGYSQSEAAECIITYNIYGMDISERAYQLAYFSVMMRARKYSRSIFRKRISPNIFLLNSYDIETGIIDFISEGDLELKNDLLQINEVSKKLGVAGSLLEICGFDFCAIESRLQEIKNSVFSDLISISYQNICANDIEPLVRKIKGISAVYDVVVTNPPYIGNKYLPKELKRYIETNFKEYKSDIFSAFIPRILDYCKPDGHIGMLTPYVWMFISAYEKLRLFLLESSVITSLVQLEYNAFEAACVPVCSFTLKKTKEIIEGEYVKLSDFKGADIQGIKVKEAVKNDRCGYRYKTSQKTYEMIPNTPIAYWVSKSFSENYSKKSVSNYAEVITGMTIGDNNAYLRLWFEVDKNKIAFDYDDMANVDLNHTKWIPYSKGGARRNWYGNYEYVVNWSQKDKFNRSKTTLQHLYLKEALTWPFITSGDFSARILPKGFLWDVAGSPCFFKDERIKLYALGALCSKAINYTLNAVNPTINVQAVDIANLPLIIGEEHVIDEVVGIVNENLQISKRDWNMDETSWEFKKHPLLEYDCSKIEDAYNLLNEKCYSDFYKLKNNEERLNEIFIKLYGLEDDISKDVDDEAVTVRKPVRSEIIKSFISYAVGCMMGRYSLDIEGVVYSGGDINEQNYKKYSIDKDGIIPICDDEYFDDDIVIRFIDFVKVVFGTEYLEENLKYIAESINSGESSRRIIRDYFITEFYDDHCNSYTSRGAGKRPIYWLLDSGKKNGFKALMYMHRYKNDTMARVRTDYVHEQQSRYRTLISEMEQRVNSVSTSERVKINKALKVIKEQSDELRIYEEKIHHLADQMISIDLDDGVKVNYEKFKDVLAKIK